MSFPHSAPAREARSAPDSIPFDVVIAGYGPTGATMANLLGQRGWRVAVVERELAPYDKPRAITADHEALRVFQEIGLAHEIAGDATAHPGTDFVGVEGQVIKRFYPAPPPHPLGWLPNWMFVQPRLEAALRAGVARFPQVQVASGHEFIAFAQDAQGVDVRIARTADGAESVLRCRYLLASDGGRSTVRRLMNAAIEDLAFDEWWLVVDARIRGPVTLPPRAVQYCRPSRPGTYIQGPDDVRRWEIKMLPGERPDDFRSEDAVLRVLATFVDTTHLELWRSATYRFHALVAQDWRRGRVLLMGDAAHQMPPFLGQGMCAGVRDASNLAWKLDAVLAGRASEGLLDTYGEERKPHVRTVVAHAKSFGLIIGELDEAAARERDRRLGAELASGQAVTVRQRFTPNLEGGLIARGAPGAGEVFPQPWARSTPAGDWQRLDDLTGTGFRLVVNDARTWDALSPAARAAWSALDGESWLLADGVEVPPPAAGALPAFCERDDVLAAWLQAQRACAVIVRPDHYVYGTAAEPAGLATLLASLHDAIVPAAGPELSIPEAA